MLIKVPTPKSTIFEFDGPEWATALHERALRPIGEPDVEGLIEWFRTRNMFYRERLKGITKWENIPVLEREELDEICDFPLGPEEEVLRTSGTSGNVARVRNHWREHHFRHLLMYRPFGFLKLPTVVTQLSFTDEPEYSPSPPSLNIQIGNRQYWRWCVDMNSPLKDQFEIYRQFRPVMLTGYPSGILRFVEEFEGDIEVDGLRLISTGGEFLSQNCRDTLQDVLKAPVIDRYSSTEGGPIGWSCPLCGDYHVNADEIIVEPRDGFTLVTPLFFARQPLLRYRLEDKTKILPRINGRCPISLPRFRIEEARRDDWLVDSLNQQISPWVFFFEEWEGVERWQIYQDHQGKITMYLDAQDDVFEFLSSAARVEIKKVVKGRSVEVVKGVEKFHRRGKYKRVKVSSELRKNRIRD